jgi:hypothetical protein
MPRPWRSHALHERVEAVSSPQKWPRRGRPPQPEGPQSEVRSRLVGQAEALAPPVEAYGWTGLATPLGREGCAEAELLQAYQEQPITVAAGFRWSKNHAAISPGWLEKPARIAALAMLTVLGFLVSAGMQRQVRLYLRKHDQYVPGNKGLTSTPAAAVVFALFAPVMLVPCAVDEQLGLQGHGLQGHHGIVCEAVGIDPSWYQITTTGQNSLPRAIPP